MQQGILGQQKKVFVTILLLLGVAFLYLLRPVFIPLFLAIITATLFYPIYEYLLKFFRNKSFISSFVATLLVFFVIVLPLTWMAILIFNEVRDFLTSIDINGLLKTTFSTESYKKHVEPFIQKHNLPIDLPALAKDVISKTLVFIYNLWPKLLERAASFIFGFMVMHFTLFFLFREGRSVLKVVSDLSPFKKEHHQRLIHESRNMIYACVYGYLITALVQGVLAYFGFWIVGVDAPLVFGALTFIMSLVPVLGAASVWIPIAIWLFAKGDTSWGIFMVIYGVILISSIDNFLRPLLMKGRANIHILILFFSLLGGIFLFGPIGILFGPVLAALFSACLRIYREDYLVES